MTDVEERCERSDLLVSQCAHCQGHTLVAPAAVKIERIMRANYSGHCAISSEHPIEPGAQIGWTEHGWICAECIDTYRFKR